MFFLKILEEAAEMLAGKKFNLYREILGKKEVRILIIRGK